MSAGLGSFGIYLSAAGGGYFTARAALALVLGAYIVSGVGFLGGGGILRHGMNVTGINTAATIWCSAAVGTHRTRQPGKSHQHLATDRREVTNVTPARMKA
jgi:uncharacterized membrane protein YhiD involved in acid resistance